MMKPEKVHSGFEQSGEEWRRLKQSGHILFIQHSQHQQAWPLGISSNSSVCLWRVPASYIGRGTKMAGMHACAGGQM